MQWHEKYLFQSVIIPNLWLKSQFECIWENLYTKVIQHILLSPDTMNAKPSRTWKFWKPASIWALSKLQEKKNATSGYEHFVRVVWSMVHNFSPKSQHTSETQTRVKIWEDIVQVWEDIGFSPKTQDTSKSQYPCKPISLVLGGYAIVIKIHISLV